MLGSVARYNSINNTLTQGAVTPAYSPPPLPIYGYGDQAKGGYEKGRLEERRGLRRSSRPEPQKSVREVARDFEAKAGQDPVSVLAHNVGEALSQVRSVIGWLMGVEKRLDESARALGIDDDDFRITPTPDVVAPTESNSPTRSKTGSISKTPTRTRTGSPGSSRLPSGSPSESNPESQSSSTTISFSISGTSSPTETRTGTGTATETGTGTGTGTRTGTGTGTRTATGTRTRTSTETSTETGSITLSSSSSPTPSVSLSLSASATASPSLSAWIESYLASLSDSGSKTVSTSDAPSTPPKSPSKSAAPSPSKELDCVVNGTVFNQDDGSGFFVRNGTEFCTATGLNFTLNDNGTLSSSDLGGNFTILPGIDCEVNGTCLFDEQADLKCYLDGGPVILKNATLLMENGQLITIEDGAIVDITENNVVHEGECDISVTPASEASHSPSTSGPVSESISVTLSETSSVTLSISISGSQAASESKTSTPSQSQSIFSTRTASISRSFSRSPLPSAISVGATRFSHVEKDIYVENGVNFTTVDGANFTLNDGVLSCGPCNFTIMPGASFDVEAGDGYYVNGTDGGAFFKGDNGTAVSLGNATLVDLESGLNFIIRDGKFVGIPPLLDDRGNLVESFFDDRTGTVFEAEVENGNLTYVNQTLHGKSTIKLKADGTPLYPAYGVGDGHAIDGFGWEEWADPRVVEPTPIVQPTPAAVKGGGGTSPSTIAGAVVGSVVGAAAAVGAVACAIAKRRGKTPCPQIRKASGDQAAVQNSAPRVI